MLRTAGSRRGFSLVEIVIVVMILGILGSIAAPKLLGTSQQAVDQGLRHTLSVIRTAIHSFAADHAGELPGADGSNATFITEMDPYLRGADFPSCPVGAAENNAVLMQPGTGPVEVSSADTYSWVYLYETGDFHVNSVEVSFDGTTYDQC
jgi:general secretion pathway protein G